MPINPNTGLPGLPTSPLLNLNKNVNPTGMGGTLGGLTPQGGFAGATMNSTAYSPNQYGGLQNTILSGPSIPSWIPGSSEGNLWQQIVGQQQQQNQYYKQILANTRAASGIQAQILAYQKMLEQQARATAPTSGAYWFLGGL